MGKHWRKPALWCSVVLAVAVIVPVASGIAASTQRSTVPAQLVGIWTRTVTKADAQREGAPLEVVGLGCTLTIKKSGRDNASVLLGPAGELVGDVVSAGTGRVHIQLGSPAASVYRWKLAGRLDRKSVV